MELSSPKIKKVLIFSQSKLFLCFRKWRFFKELLYNSGGNFLSSENFFYISENGTFYPQSLKNYYFFSKKHFLRFQKGTFQA